MMPIILGVDPGCGGALAYIDTDANTIRAYPMPSVKNGTRSQVDPVGVGGLVSDEPCDFAYVEEVHSMTGQGVASTFTFGEGYGIVKGALGANHIPITLVRPQVWKRGVRIPPAKGAKKSEIKRLAVDRANTLMPDCKSLWPRAKDDGVAEAALIAFYGALMLNKIPTKPLTICPEFERQRKEL